MFKKYKIKFILKYVTHFCFGSFWKKTVDHILLSYVLVLTKLTHVFAHPDGGHSVLVKLHDDVQTCAYEDVQVMWEMLQRAETDRLAREPSPKGARALVWLRRHHKMDPRRRC